MKANTWDIVYNIKELERFISITKVERSSDDDEDWTTDPDQHFPVIVFVDDTNVIGGFDIGEDEDWSDHPHVQEFQDLRLGKISITSALSL